MELVCLDPKNEHQKCLLKREHWKAGFLSKKLLICHDKYSRKVFFLLITLVKMQLAILENLWIWPDFRKWTILHLAYMSNIT